MDITLHKIMDLLWKRGIKEIDFCKATGINKSAVTDWKTGKTMSYRKHIAQISEFLQTPSEYLTEPTILVSDPNEIQLIESYCSMSNQGKELAIQLLDGIKDKYKKYPHIPDMESVD